MRPDPTPEERVERLSPLHALSISPKDALQEIREAEGAAFKRGIVVACGAVKRIFQSGADGMTVAAPLRDILNAIEACAKETPSNGP